MLYLCCGERMAILKKSFLVCFGLAARQFNAVAATVQGKIASLRKRRPQLMVTLDRRIARAQTVLLRIRRGTTQYHQKRRRVEILKRRLAALRADDAAGCVRLCFGSRKLFHAQFALKENGYASHGEWRCRISGSA